MSRPLDPLTLPLRGSRLVEASAGTGKTWTIAALYLRLVLGHGGPEAGFRQSLAPRQILVMTFTVAATRELSERIRDRLVEAAQGFRGARAVDPSDAFLHDLIASYPDGRQRDEAAWRLSTAAESMDDAAVLTIDAWVQRMLREHAFDSGSLFDDEVRPDDASLLVEAARDYWRREVYPLDRSTLEGVLDVWPDVGRLTTDMRSLIVRADAEAEPTLSLAEVWRVASADRVRRLHALKQRWSAAGADLRAWLLDRLQAPDKPFDGRQLKAHLIVQWLDAIDAWAADPEQPSYGLTDAARRRLSRAGLTEVTNAGRRVDIPDAIELVVSLHDAVERLEPPSHAMRRHAMARIAAGVLALKQRIGAYGFDDLLRRLDRALAGPHAERLRQRIVAQYPAAMIDEFQDTSPLQYRIFDRLYRIADDDPASVLLLIGDPKQSIYGFRGADIHSYLRARRATGDRHHLLTTNFRSTGPLVAAVNRLFGQGESRPAGAFRFGTAAGTPNPVPYQPVDARGRPEVLRDSAGPIAALTLCHDAALSSKRDAERRFAGHCAEAIVSTLNDPLGGFVAGSADPSADPSAAFRRLRPADITVLVRDRHEAASIRRALQARGVPSVFLSVRESVFESAEASDLLHWLHAVADPFDTRLARVAFATGLVGLPIAEIARFGQDDLAFEARVADLVMLHAEWRRQGVLPMLRRTLHRLDLPSRWLALPDGERKLTNVLHLAELLQAASAKLDGEHALIRWLADQVAGGGERADEQIVRLESDADLVKVVTIHAAKGLEYPVVYVPFVCAFRKQDWKPDDVAIVVGDDGERDVVFGPDKAARDRVVLEQRQEDLRLLYVAVTRARHALWLGIAPLKDGQAARCGFHRSAFGYLVAGDAVVEPQAIAARLHDAFAGLPSVRIDAPAGPAAMTMLLPSTADAPLVDAPDYAARFERDWSIGSFSALVRDLERLPAVAAMVDPAVEEELLSAPSEGIDGSGEPSVASNAPRHRFPRGALAGNFLHDQLEWLASHRFALCDDAALQAQLKLRCERQGWGPRAGDVVAWMTEVVSTPLPPLGIALDALPRIVPELEFWFPSEGAAARRIDALCRTHLLDGRERPPLPGGASARSLRGMLMGFADLVFELDGRYWVLDYKSNALGSTDAAYTADALAASMADHRYDVQSAIYLLALHRLLKQRLGRGYDPARQLGGALYLYLRGIRGPVAGCHVVRPPLALLDALDEAFGLETVS